MITKSFVIGAFALLWAIFPDSNDLTLGVMNWSLAASWFENCRFHELNCPVFQCRRQFMHHRCKSWSKPIHARKGNSLWARIDNFSKTFVIARAHFCRGFLLFYDSTKRWAKTGKNLQNRAKTAFFWEKVCFEGDWIRHLAPKTAFSVTSCKVV